MSGSPSQLSTCLVYTGWGSWVGEDLKHKKSEVRHFPNKCPSNTKYVKSEHVVMNKQENKKFAKHLVCIYIV